MASIMARLMRLIMAVGFSCLFVFPLSADQTDPRLDELFIALQEAPLPKESVKIEQRIWAIWTLSGDKEVDALMRDGVDAMNEGQLDVAIRLFGAATEKAPNYAEGWNRRATVLFYAGYPDESMHDIQRTLALEPRHFGAISGMGLIFMQRQDWASALRAFEQVLEIHPSAQHAHIHVEELRKKLAVKGA